MDIDKILASIVIEEAPPGLVGKWKVNLRAREMVGERNVLWLYIVLPLLVSAGSYYIGVFRRELLLNFSINSLPRLVDTAAYAFTKFVSSTDFQIWSIGLSLLIAGLSLVWFFIRDYKSNIVFQRYER